jgi:hypothetical protein
MTAVLDPKLREVLDRSVVKGVITDEQAQALRVLYEVLELPEVAEPSEPRGRPWLRAVVAEVLGYVGGMLAATSAIVVVSQYWADLRPGARVALLGVTALALLAAGWPLRGEGRPEVARLGSFMWLLSAAALTVAAAQVGIGLLSLREESTALLTASSSAVYAGALWWWRRRTLQQLAAFAAVCATGVSGLAVIEAGLATWGGLLVWGLGVAWLLLAWGRVIKPVDSAFVIGAAASLLGPLVGAGDVHLWQLLIGLATAAALIALSVALRRMPLLGLGVAGLFVFIPRVIFGYFGEALGAPLALFLTGVLLIAGSLATLRIRPREG